MGVGQVILVHLIKSGYFLYGITKIKQDIRLFDLKNKKKMEKCLQKYLKMAS